MTDIKSISSAPNETVTLIFADTTEYRRIYDNKAVKKTLSVPSWLNVRAERLGINFFYVLQQALIKAVEKEEAAPDSVKNATSKNQRQLKECKHNNRAFFEILRAMLLKAQRVFCNISDPLHI